MKSILLIALLLTVGCSNAIFLTPKQNAIYGAIEKKRCTGISEGPKLTLKEHSRKELAFNCEKKVLIYYYLDVSGVHPGERYDLFLIKQDQFIVSLGEYRVNDDLELVDVSNQYLLKNSLATYGGHMFGEIISYALINKETKVISVLVYAPNPIEARWEDGGYASVTSLGPDMNQFCLRCTGFDPKETIHYTSRCCGEMKEQDYPVEADGTLTIILVPGEGNAEGGVNRITLNRSSGERIIKIPFGSYARDKRYWRNF